jgi:hypothetical protein
VQEFVFLANPLVLLAPEMLQLVLLVQIINSYSIHNALLNALLLLLVEFVRIYALQVNILLEQLVKDVAHLAEHAQVLIYALVAIQDSIIKDNVNQHAHQRLLILEVFVLIVILIVSLVLS